MYAAVSLRIMVGKLSLPGASEVKCWLVLHRTPRGRSMEKGWFPESCFSEFRFENRHSEFLNLVFRIPIADHQIRVFVTRFYGISKFDLPSESRNSDL